MKKFLIVFGLVLGFASAVYADGYFCCSGSKKECCAEKGKMYCPSDNSCRTRCPKVTSPECIGGCINPEGVCCAWCPSREVCEAMGKCQKIVDGCYTCVECPVLNPCPAPQCLNEEELCCDSCPRICPEGQCLINVGGCYECGSCGGDDDDDDDDDDITEPDLCVKNKVVCTNCKTCDPEWNEDEENWEEYTFGGWSCSGTTCSRGCVKMY